MSRKLKIVQNDADIVPAPQVPESQGPHGSTTSVGLVFTPAPTRKRHAGWNCCAQRVRGTGEHGSERQRPRAYARTHTR